MPNWLKDKVIGPDLIPAICIVLAILVLVGGLLVANYMAKSDQALREKYSNLSSLASRAKNEQVIIVAYGDSIIAIQNLPARQQKKMSADLKRLSGVHKTSMKTFSALAESFKTGMIETKYVFADSARAHNLGFNPLPRELILFSK